MVANPPCLLVVCLLEGRHFPTCKPTDEVFVEAKFGGETLSTDPITAQDRPSFNSELAFEIDRKALHLHRLQRTPVKLQVFCQSLPNASHHPLGQIVLDLRQAKEISSAAVWFPVLHCKHRGNRPEILLSFYLETANKRSVKNTRKPQEAIAQENQTPQISDPFVRPSSSESTMPSKTDKNLPQQPTNKKSEVKEKISEQVDRVVPQKLPKPNSNSKQPIGKSKEDRIGTRLPPQPGSNSSDVLTIKLSSDRSYYIFDQDGDTGRLYRACVTLVFALRLQLLRTTLPGPYCFMYALLGNEVRSEPFPSLEKSEFPAERATVRIRGLRSTITNYFAQNQHLRVSLISLSSTPATFIASCSISLRTLVEDEIVEGIYPIGEYSGPVTLDQAACVGLSMTLAPEPQDNSDSSSSTCDSEKSSNNASSKAAENSAAPTTLTPINLEGNISETVSTGSKKKQVNGVLPKPSVYPDTVASSNAKSNNDCSDTGLKIPSKKASVPSASVSDVDSGTNETQNKPVDCDLKHKESKSSNSVSKKEHKKERLDNGQSEGCSDTELVHFCLNIEIKSVRLLSHNNQGQYYLQYNYPYVGANSPIQTTPMNLDSDEKLIPNGQRSFCFVTIFQKLREAFNRLPLSIELMSNNQTVGLTRLMLEPLLSETTTAFTHPSNVRGYRSTYDCRALILDFESAAIAQVVVGTSLDRLEGPANVNCVTELLNAGGSAPLPPSSFNAFDVAAKHIRKPTEAELRTTLELEMWRERQEEMFREQLKRKEEMHLSVLAQEWKTRDAERELLLQTRLNECSSLEDKLRRALGDIESREVKLRKREEALIRKESDVKRKTEDLEQKSKLQTNHQRPLTERNQKSVEHNLRCRIVTLERELDESKQQLTKALESKSRYKHQWASTLQKMINIQNTFNAPLPQVQMASQLHRRTTTEPKQRLAEEHRLLESERSQLREIQKGMDQLKISATRSVDPTASTSHDNSFTRTPEYLQQLEEERKLLLGTRSYTASSREIQELDRHIKMIRDNL